MTRSLAALALLAATATSTPALAAPGDGPMTQAVQNRLHTMRNEYTVWLGVLPVDAFTKGLTFTGAYTLHINELLAWEIGEFTYSVGVNTRLEEELNNLPQPVGATPFESVRFYGTSNIVLKPMYGKFALLNRTLVYQEIYLVAGAGAGKLTITSRPVIDVGVGARFYTGDHTSLRFDFRDYMFVNANDFQNEIWLGAGLSVAFGGT